MKESVSRMNERNADGTPRDHVYHAVLPDLSRGLDPNSFMGESPYWQEKTVCGRKSRHAAVLVQGTHNLDVVGCKACLKKLCK
jgi:hypothetical protein